MKNLSIAKLIVALCICNAYVFSCGLVGEIGSGEEKQADSEPDASETGEALPENNAQGTVDFIIPNAPPQTEKVVISQLRFDAPPLSKSPVQSTYISKQELLLEPETVNETEPPLEIASSETELILPEEPTETEPEQTTRPPEPETEPPVTTPEQTTTPPPETTPEPPKTTTPPPETTTEPPETTPTPPETTTPPPDTSTYSTTPPNTNPAGGIPVEEITPSYATTTPVPTTATTPAVTDVPTETETNTAAASEILYVNNAGETVSGSAIDIVSRITQNEMGYTFAPEAIKAQAVATYTYVKYCNMYGSYPSVLLSETVNDSVRVLVSSVIGQAVYYEDNYIQSVYSASSAGYTASSVNVWGNAYPYLTSVYCELDSQYDPNYGRKATFTSEDMKSRVYNATGIALTGDPSGWFAIDEREDGNYVAQVNVGGYHSYTNSSGKSVKISGKVFREKIMTYDIRSAAFDISYDSAADQFTITTYGYGHGVGMSQNGANALATYWGWDYKQILEFYYTGTVVR